MKRLIHNRNLQSQLNTTRIQTVCADLDLALTFVDVAASSSHPEVRKRNCENARKAFFTVRDQFLPACALDDAERTTIETKLNQLRAGLEQLGEKIG